MASNCCLKWIEDYFAGDAGLDRLITLRGKDNGLSYFRPPEKRERQRREHAKRLKRHIIIKESPHASVSLQKIEQGAVEKSRQRRSRQFSVLTYWKYAPRAKLAAALLDELF